MPTQEEIDDRAEEKLCELMQRRIQAEEKSHASYQAIPRFYFKVSPIARHGELYFLIQLPFILESLR